MENARRNHVEENTRFFHGSIECVQGPYDILLSNITKIDNMDMMPRFHALLNPGGKLILSGFYSADAEDVRTVFEQLGLRFVKEMREDEWSAILAVEEET